MSKPHASLSPATNILLIFAWALVVTTCLSFVEPRVPIAIAVVGAALGGVAGFMQHRSFMQATSGFSMAASLLDVRAAFNATTWGARRAAVLSNNSSATAATTRPVVSSARWRPSSTLPGHRPRPF